MNPPPPQASPTQREYLRYRAGIGPEPSRVIWPTISVCLQMGWTDNDGITPAGLAVVDPNPDPKIGVRYTFELVDGSSVTAVVALVRADSLVVGPGVELHTSLVVSVSHA